MHKSFIVFFGESWIRLVLKCFSNVCFLWCLQKPQTTPNQQRRPFQTRTINRRPVKCKIRSNPQTALDDDDGLFLCLSSLFWCGGVFQCGSMPCLPLVSAGDPSGALLTCTQLIHVASFNVLGVVMSILIGDIAALMLKIEKIQ